MDAIDTATAILAFIGICASTIAAGRAIMAGLLLVVRQFSPEGSAT